MLTPDLAPDEAARWMLGARLTTTIDGSTTSIIVGEVEAYGGADDAASHARSGPTVRNAAMFGPTGTLYVYRSYGIHWCLNIATGLEGHGSAVLLRGGIAETGVGAMAQRRGRATDLVNGPGKLTQALGVDNRFDGARAKAGGERSGDEAPGDGDGGASAGGGRMSLWWSDVEDGGTVRLTPRAMSPVSVTATPRIGISREIERPWRFVATF